MIEKQPTNRFVIKRSELNTLKLFVEFYLPEHQELLNKLREGPFDVQPLRRICTRMFDGPFGSDRKVEMYQSSGIPFLRVKDVLPEGLVQKDLMYISVEKHAELARSKVLPGNVVMTIAGRVGTAAVFPKELEEGNITGHIVGFELSSDINPHYVALFLNSYLGEFQVKRWSHRTTRPELNLFEIGQIEVALPLRRIQDRIAQVMQDAYAVRRAKLVEAELLSHETSEFVLQRLGVNVNAVENKRVAVKSIRTLIGKRFDFEAVVTMNELTMSLTNSVMLRDVVFHINDRITPADTYPNDEVNYVGLGDIVSNIGELSSFMPTQGTEILSSSPIFREGDILFARMRPYLNKVWLAEFDGVCSGEALVLRPNLRKVDPSFLYALLLSRVTLDQIVPLQSGTSLPRVSASDVLNVKLPIPDDIQLQYSIGREIIYRRDTARRLRAEAETVVAEAKARVERMLLGEEAVE